MKDVIHFMYSSGCSGNGRDAFSVGLNFLCFIPSVRIVLLSSASSYFLTDRYNYYKKSNYINVSVRNTKARKLRTKSK